MAEIKTLREEEKLRASLDGTIHDEYREVRLEDGSIDINASSGSDSNIIIKKIYQTDSVNITVSAISATSAIGGAATTKVISTSAGQDVGITPFSITFIASSPKTLTLDKSNIETSLIATVTRNISAGEPIAIAGENIYGAARSVAAGGANETTTNGAVSSGTTITMTTAVASIPIVVGDRVSAVYSPTTTDQANAVLAFAGDVRYVTALTGTYTFTVSSALESTLPDDSQLTFYTQSNRKWSIDNIHGLDTSMEVYIANKFVNQTTDAFLTSPVKIQDYLDVTTINEDCDDEYKITNLSLSAFDTLGVKPTISTSSAKVTTTVQTGNIIFAEPAIRALESDAIKVIARGIDSMNKLYDCDIELSDLTVTLEDTTTTTTADVNNSTTIPITNRLGILNTYSTVSGIGINPTVTGTDTVDGTITNSSRVVMDTNVDTIMKPGDKVTGDGIDEDATVVVVDLNPDNDNVKEFSVSEEISVSDGVTLSFNGINPIVSTGASGNTGSGNIVVSTAQTLESGQTLTFPGAGNTITIAGNIKINKMPNKNMTVGFDVERLVTERP